MRAANAREKMRGFKKTTNEPLLWIFHSYLWPLAKLNNDICDAVRVFAYFIIAPISKLRADENLLPFNVIHLRRWSPELKSLLVNNFLESGRLFLISLMVCTLAMAGDFNWFIRWFAEQISDNTRPINLWDLFQLKRRNVRIKQTFLLFYNQLVC